MGSMQEEDVFRFFSGKFTSKIELCQHLKTRQRPFFFPWDQRRHYSKFLKEGFPSTKVALLDEADKLVSGKFNLLGSRFDFGSSEQICWNVAENGGTWPTIQWAGINIETLPNLGDVKVTWELNRHQHFLTLGRAWWFSGDRRYPEAFRKQIVSWIKQNPPETGINWQSNLELALRSISWIWSLHFFLETIQEEDLFEIIRSLIHHGVHLEKHLSYSEMCMRNNHLVGDAAGLAFIGMFLPELKCAERWRERAFQILWKEAKRQVYPDGTSFEQSTDYLAFVGYLYLNVALYAGILGENVPKIVFERLEKISFFLSWIHTENCSFPGIGDSDSGQVTPLTGSGREGGSDSFLSTAAFLFNQRNFSPLREGANEEPFWLFGPKVLEFFKSGEPIGICQNEEILFPNGGFLIRRWNMKLKKKPEEAVLVFHSGPSSKHHAHADQLSFTVSVGGIPFLVDSGTYRYGCDPEIRDYYRSTRAHNTISVDGQSQMTPYRAFRWLDKGKSGRLMRLSLEGLIFYYSSYRKKYWQDLVEHSRGIVFLDSQSFLVLDRLAGNVPHDYEALFHFAPDFCLDPCKDEAFAYTTNYRLESRLPQCRVSNLDHRWVGEIRQGFVSTAYGIQNQAPVLVFSSQKQTITCCAVLFRFSPRRPTDEEQEFVERVKNKGVDFLQGKVCGD